MFDLQDKTPFLIIQLPSLYCVDAKKQPPIFNQLCGVYQVLTTVSELEIRAGLVYHVM